jgi:hypothetical protein
MIRYRPNAENTMKGAAPRNAWWNDIKSSVCLYCGQIHDSAGRTLDERGKLVDQPARPDIPRVPNTCPLVK